tara:strand:+ start:1034 stop:1633 length:600 start_codon:yes stop_codon:yes gene_type:complete
MIVIGTGGHAKVISDILILTNIKLAAYYDDRNIKTFLSKNVFSPVKTIPEASDTIIAIGNNRIRKRISMAHPNLNYKIAIHPRSVIDRSVFIDDGSVIMASVTINHSTKIGKHCIINTSSSIDHDCNINDFTHISPGAVLCGGVHISEGAQVGANSVISPNIKIGKWATIGAGAVIINDIPEYAVVVGNPGKIIKFNEK